MAIVLGNLNLLDNLNLRLIILPRHRATEFYPGLVACLQYVLQLKRMLGFCPGYPYVLRLVLIIVHVAGG